MDNDKAITYTCPYCERTKIETAASAPYVRGFVLAFQIGAKNFIGCTSCVRGKVLGEAGLSLLCGWFSITAFFINPVLILYNVLQAPFISKNYAKARKKLSDAGIEDDESSVDVTRLGYSLATSMMAADGHIDEEEIIVALELGNKIFPDFNENELRQIVNVKDLPPPLDIATMLREILTEEGKRAVCLYLVMIAQADGNFDDFEKKLLSDVADKMGFDLDSLNDDDDEVAE
ncbi:MAG: TerB family tellurite resistance protein [Lentisphaeria bacterium]|nr:TerB family tellurite resistance protein [Lentisphaeria bacterium]NQZ66909.1 TerB family tellurite resistance protein [Lentisphaeria bacterium]